MKLYKRKEIAGKIVASGVEWFGNYSWFPNVVEDREKKGYEFVTTHSYGFDDVTIIENSLLFLKWIRIKSTDGRTYKPTKIGDSTGDIYGMQITERRKRASLSR